MMPRLTSTTTTAKTHALTNVVPSSDGLLVRYGCGQSACTLTGAGVCLDIASPVLSGEPTEMLLDVGPGSQVVGKDGFSAVKSSGLMAGATVLEVPEGGLEECTFDLYRRLLNLLPEGWRLYRVWNYLPDINREVGGLENYRAFNLGRWRVFEGNPQEPEGAIKLPAASAVGVGGNHLTLAFVAGEECVECLENPAQVPAYRYPEDYGPRPPSFCRGTKIPGRGLAYLSGTASIRGYETVGRGDLAEQVRVTAENIGVMKEALGVPGGGQFKCYLRHARDLQQARDLLRQELGGEASEILYLEADICRGDLLIEIEGVFKV